MSASPVFAGLIAKYFWIRNFFKWYLLRQKKRLNKFRNYWNDAFAIKAVSSKPTTPENTMEMWFFRWFSAQKPLFDTRVFPFLQSFCAAKEIARYWIYFRTVNILFLGKSQIFIFHFLLYVRNQVLNAMCLATVSSNGKWSHTMWRQIPRRYLQGDSFEYF